MSENFNKSQRMRDETLVWVRHCLGLGPAPTSIPSNTLIRNFASVGKHLQEKCDSCKCLTSRGSETLLNLLDYQAQRTKLFQQIKYYVEESGIEQQIGLRSQLPTLQEYRERRMGTSAVYVFLALTESVSIVCRRVSCPMEYIHFDKGT